MLKETVKGVALDLCLVCVCHQVNPRRSHSIITLRLGLEYH